MDRWLSQIGLKGRALQIATKACEDNLVEDLSGLNILAADENQFEKAFPQALLRTMILNALASDEHKEVKAKASERTQIKTDNDTDTRYTEFFVQSTLTDLLYNHSN